MNPRQIRTEQDKTGEPAALEYRTAVQVWVGLLLLTALTVLVARLHVGRWSVVSALGIATVKAGLVVTFFMGLRHETRAFWWMLLLTLVTLATIIGLTYVDVLFR